MTAWTIVAVPLLIMFFALGMERVESRLSQGRVGENDVAEFLEQARPSEVRALFRHGISRALDLFRLRRRSPGPARHAITVRSPRSRRLRSHTTHVPRSAATTATAATAAQDSIAGAIPDAISDPIPDAIAEAGSRAS
jgi:hypothetical protein